MPSRAVRCFAFLTAAMASTSAYAQTDAQPENIPDGVTGHHAYVGVGYSTIISRFETDWTSGEPRLGWDWQAGYEWISRRNIGAGFFYSGYLTKGKMVVPSGYSVATLYETVMLSYFAPQFAGRFSLRSDRWILNYSVGFGLAMLYDKVSLPAVAHGKNIDYGFGSNINFGIELRTSKRFSVTAGVSLIGMSIDQEYMGEKPDIPEGETNGVGRVSIDFGLKYHF